MQQISFNFRQPKSKKTKNKKNEHSKKFDCLQIFKDIVDFGVSKKVFIPEIVEVHKQPPEVFYKKRCS